MNDETVSVLVVDDDPDLLETIPILLGASGRLRVAGVAADTPRALTLSAAVRPDVVLADIRMPGPDGISLTRALTGGDRSHRPKVLVVTAFALDHYLLAAIGGGASGFLPKGLPWEQIEQAVIDVHHGRTALPPHLALRTLELSLTGHPGLGSLSKRELQVLAQVGTGASPKQIATVLHVSEGTIKVHLEHLRSKLDATTQVQLAIIALRAGLTTPELAADPRRPGPTDSAPQ